MPTAEKTMPQESPEREQTLAGTLAKDVGQKSLFSQGFHDTNAALSLLGFFITLWVFWNVRSIKSSFQARGRLPDIIKDVRTLGSAMNLSLHKWPSQRNELVGHLKSASTILKSGTAFTPKEDRKKLEKICKKFDAVSNDSVASNNLDLNAAWDLYSDIQNCLTIFTQSSKNLKWEA